MCSSSAGGAAICSNCCGGMATGCAIPLQKTHSIEFESRRLCYPWHRWFDRTVLTRRAGGSHADTVYFCRLPQSLPHAMFVEIPKWMFDGAQCASMHLAELPHVDCATLRALKNTITEQSASVKATVLQTQLSLQTHGDTHGNTSRRRANETNGAVWRTSRSAK